ncbi:VaFE repeat-containing surface-anchored protein [Listeria rocourtiae]|uniref:SpaA isopeptide-forming pilin-related protein n=1 Tax=Listeria rocourtiae TaxID=647910 RepID=UPI001624C8BD|nr:SpaA isopeptide-forming pilin-related protein [Listeria rocourtiae]MBC1604456.1 VaFE repeat-containing surface-anchored protein [Listeria rocourtiae]
MNQLKLFKKGFAIFMIALITLSTVFTPLKNVFASELETSPDGELKSKEMEEALKKGVQNSKLRLARSGSTVVYKGQVIYGPNIVGHFEVDGEQAFCIEHPKPTPGTGTSNDGGNIYDNPKVAAALYYGITGDGNMFGSDWTRGTVLTSLVVSEMYLGSYQGGQSVPGYDAYRAKAASGDYPKADANFSDTVLASSIVGGVQRTQTTKLNADVSNKFQFTNIPAEVTLHNVTTGAQKTGGTATIKGGDSIYFTAPLTYDKNFASGALKGSMKDYSPILYKMDDDSLQKLVKGGWFDPTKTISLTAQFEARTGDLDITKKGTDGKLLAGASYALKNAAGTVVANVTTGTNGKVSIKDLPQGDYTATETKAPAGYTIDTTPRKVTITAGQTALLTFTNKFVSFRITGHKADSETGDAAQGDAKLSGGKYGLYADAAATVLFDEAVIDAKGNFTFKTLPLEGSSKTVYVKETVAPEGYNLDTTIYPAVVTQTDNTTEVIVQNKTYTDKVMKGSFDLTKFGNKPLLQSQLEGLKDGQKLPLLGAEFTVTHDKTGKVVQVKETDLKGYVNFTGLPYGDYTVTETKAPFGYKPVAPFKVHITAEGQHFSYLIEDKVIEAKVKIVKLDATTGKTVPLAGTEYQILDSEKNVVKFHVNYPADQDMDTFTSTADGTLVLPDALPIGQYYLVETKAPAGYLINPEPVAFEIASDHDGQMITVEMKDAPAMGKIKGTKIKEVIDPENVDPEKIVYKDIPAEDITFDVIATSDIVTPDGTVRFQKGDIVDTVKTDATGYFESTKELYVGENNTYQLVETNAPEEYHTLAPIDFTLAYADGVTPLVWKEFNVKNELIKPIIGTKATGINGEKVLNPLENTTLVDQIEYKNLLVGKEYTVVTKAVNPLKEEVYVSKTTKFTPTTQNGTYEVKVDVNGRQLAGKDVVFKEYLYYKGEEVAKHANPKDKGQTVHFINPKLGTTATFENGKKTIDPTGDVIVKDTIHYSGLIPGQKVKVVTQAVDNKTEEVIKSEEGFFTPKTASGNHVVSMPLNGKELAGRDIVFYEFVYTPEGKLIAKHEDINDKGQTVHFNDIKPVPAPEKPAKIGFLPTTGDNSMDLLVLAGLLLIVTAGVYLVRRKKANQ